jgi:NADPH oxidase
MQRRKRGDENAMKLKKVYLFWLNRDQFSFEWFTEALKETESDEFNSLFTNTTYITGAFNCHDIRNFLLSLALDIAHKKSGIDQITTLKSRTLWGRPDWDAIFRILSSKHAKKDNRTNLTFLFFFRIFFLFVGIG